MPPDDGVDRTNETLCDELRRRGLECYVETENEVLAGLTGVDSRLLISEQPAILEDGTVQGSAITFWAHAGAGRFFLSPWTYNLYEAPRPELAIELVMDLFTGEFLPKGITPYDFPKPFREKYGLRQCDLLWLLPPCKFEQLDDPGVERIKDRIAPAEILRRLEGSLESVRVDERDFVHLQQGGVQALFRLAAAPELPCRKLMLLLYGRPSSSPDHLRLLEQIAEATGCPLFEDGWRTRIHSDDPYYQYTVDGKRPERPRNA